MRLYRTHLLWIAALALVGLFVFTGNAAAGPAAPGDFPYTQPDGKVVTVRQWGDEWQHGMETAEGYTVLVDPGSRFLVYAEAQPDGSLAPALKNGQMLVAGADDPGALPLKARPLPVKAPSRGPALEERSGINRTSFSGTMRTLVILVEFTCTGDNAYFAEDCTHKYSANDFKNLMFGTSSSVRDFYLKASFNKLTLSPATESHSTANDGVIGWLKLSFAHPELDGLDDVTTSWKLARAALNAANPYINYASYDTDKDGYITGKELQVVIVAAGYEGSYGGFPAVWAHQWNLDDNPLTLDGVRMAENSADGDYGGYAIVGERHGDHRAQFGTTAHEFGHLLSWPDLYDISQNSEGVGEWSIMGSGSWNGLIYPGDTPALPDAFLKWYQGWIHPAHAADNRTYSLRKGSQYPDALKLGVNLNGVDWSFYNKSGVGEYWLVGNRQLSGYDAALPGCGVLIWHIDETVTNSNSANTWEYGPLVALEQADGFNQLTTGSNRGDDGDPFPGYYDNFYFNETTNPNILYYSNSDSYMNLRVLDPGATNCADTMRVTFTTDDLYGDFTDIYIPYMQR